MPETVECYSGASYGERPRAFTWEGERLGVAEVIDRWKAPGEAGFRVRSADGRLFTLVYRPERDNWQIAPG